MPYAKPLPDNHKSQQRPSKIPRLLSRSHSATPRRFPECPAQYDMRVIDQSVGTKYNAYNGGRITIMNGTHVHTSQNAKRTMELEDYFEEFKISSLYRMAHIFTRKLDDGSQVVYLHGTVGQGSVIKTIYVYDHNLSDSEKAQKNWEENLSLQLSTFQRPGLAKYLAQMWGFAKGPNFTALIYHGVLVPVFVPARRTFFGGTVWASQYTIEEVQSLYSLLPNKYQDYSISRSEPPRLPAVPNQSFALQQYRGVFNYLLHEADVLKNRSQVQIFVNVETWQLIAMSIECRSSDVENMDRQSRRLGPSRSYWNALILTGESVPNVDALALPMEFMNTSTTPCIYLMSHNIRRMNTLGRYRLRGQLEDWELQTGSSCGGLLDYLWPRDWRAPEFI